MCAGDRALGEHFLKSIQPFVWRRSLDFGVIEEVREISARIRDHFAQGARLGPGFDLKRGRGGIREVEFFAQIQQMIHGGRDPSVRASGDARRARGAVEPPAGSPDEDADALAEAYSLLRTVEHRVQMVDDAQTHLLPLDRDALDNVATLHGLADGDELIALLQPHVDSAEVLFNSLAPDREGRLSNDPDILGDELVALGFSDPGVALKRISDWRSGKARSLAVAGGEDGVRGDAARLCCARSRRAPIPSARSTTCPTSSRGCRAASISIACWRRGPSSRAISR